MVIAYSSRTKTFCRKKYATYHCMGKETIKEHLTNVIPMIEQMLVEAVILVHFGYSF